MIKPAAARAHNGRKLSYMFVEENNLIEVAQSFQGVLGGEDLGKVKFSANRGYKKASPGDVVFSYDGATGFPNVVDRDTFAVLLSGL